MAERCRPLESAAPAAARHGGAPADASARGARPLPSISIIVPVLNEARLVAASLQQLAPLRERGVEIIVVDGGSGDGTVAAAAPGCDRLVRTAPGRALQMNAGAAVGRGDLLLFLHVDTRLPADALAQLASASTAAGPGALDARPPQTSPVHGRTAAGAAFWGRFDVAIAGRPRLLKVVAALMNLRSRCSGIATGDQAIFVSRRAFDAVGGFPVQPLMEDIEISRRLRRLARPVCVRAKVVTSGRRWEQGGTWRTILLMWRLRLLYRLGVGAERLARAYR